MCAIVHLVSDTANRLFPPSPLPVFSPSHICHGNFKRRSMQNIKRAGAFVLCQKSTSVPAFFVFFFLLSYFYYYILKIIFFFSGGIRALVLRSVNENIIFLSWLSVCARARVCLCVCACARVCVAWGRVAGGGGGVTGFLSLKKIKNCYIKSTRKDKLFLHVCSVLILRRRQAMWTHMQKGTIELPLFKFVCNLENYLLEHF